MRIVASMVVRNELNRYLPAAVAHLETYCDVVVILDDQSTDGTVEWLRANTGATVHTTEGDRGEVGTFVHEANTRQRLLELTMEVIAGLPYKPTFVLAIDADEFVADPFVLRQAVEENPHNRTFMLCMQEVWTASDEGLAIRVDGGWMEHDAGMLFRSPVSLGEDGWEFPDKALACGRVPPAVNRYPGVHTCSAVLHFGWANPWERLDRYRRYVEQDGGRFHASSHLDSIMWDDARVLVVDREWPDALSGWRDSILSQTGVTP